MAPRVLHSPPGAAASTKKSFVKLVLVYTHMSAAMTIARSAISIASSSGTSINALAAAVKVTTPNMRQHQRRTTGNTQCDALGTYRGQSRRPTQWLHTVGVTQRERNDITARWKQCNSYR